MPRCLLPAGGNDVGEDIGDVPGRDRLDQRLAFDRSRLVLDAVAEPHRLAAIGKAGIELHQILERDADAAEADGEARRLVGRQDRLHLGAAEAHQQPRRPDGVEQAHGRHVERQLQRLADADIALIGHVEIARAIAEEIGRAILDDGFLGDVALPRRQGRR